MEGGCASKFGGDHVTVLHHGEGDEKDALTMDPNSVEYESWRRIEVKFVGNVLLSAACWFWLTAAIVTVSTIVEASRKFLDSHSKALYVTCSLIALASMTLAVCMGR